MADSQATPATMTQERRLRILSVGEAMVEFHRRAADEWHQGFAGDTLNVAWALRAVLPAERADVDYLTRVGVDGFSDRFVGFLGASDLGSDHVTRDPDRNIGLYTIETDATGERSFTYWRGQSAARGLAADPEALSRAFASVDLVYLSGITLAILPADDRATLLDCLGQPETRAFSVAFDPNIRPRLWQDADGMRDAIVAAARLSDIVLPTFDDEAAAFGDTAPEVTRDRYAALGAGEVVVKDGTRPTLFRTADEQGAVDVANRVKPLDTTGAGDSFNGAYLAARLSGKPASAAIDHGQAVAACVVGHRGALVPMDTLRGAFGSGAGD